MSLVKDIAIGTVVLVGVSALILHVGKDGVKDAEDKTFQAKRRRKWWRRSKNTANRVVTGTKSNLKKTNEECLEWQKLSPSEGGPSRWYKFRCQTKGTVSLGTGGSYTSKPENRYVRNKYGCNCPPQDFIDEHW